MDRNKSWNTIANSFYAADKIRKIISSFASESRGSSAIEDTYSVITEVLKILSQHSPEAHREIFNTAVGKSVLYRNTYKNLRSHISSNSGKSFDFDSITKALAIVYPVLSNGPRINVEKILKIYELIKT